MFEKGRREEEEEEEEEEEREEEKKEKKKSVSSLPYIMQSRRELELYVVVNVGVVAVFCLFHFALLIFYND